jgi:uncharacterized membrane-anchored protein YjiN (DUF445 family)
MTIYTCENCKKEFNRKSTYDNHLNRKYPCKLITFTDNQCIYCNNTYTTVYNLNKHLNVCIKKTIEDDNKLQLEELRKLFEKKFEEQQKNNEELKKKVEELTHETNKNIISNSNNNITNNTTNNIQLNIVPAGKEDLTRLTKEEIVKICTSGTYYPIVAAEIIHCNKKYPEFQNFLISNLRSSTGLVFINDNWVSKPQDEILTNILQVDKKHVKNLMNDLQVDNKLQIKLESTKDEIDTNESKEHQKPKIKSKLYNASKMILKNKKLNDKLLENS